MTEESSGRPDPVHTTFLPPVHYSSVTELCDLMIGEYCKGKKKEVDTKKFKEAMYVKVRFSQGYLRFHI